MWSKSLKNYCEGNHVLANKVSVFTPVTQPKKKSFTGIIDRCWPDVQKNYV